MAYINGKKVISIVSGSGSSEGKVDKITDPNVVYATDENGDQTSIEYSDSDITGDSVVKRKNGTIRTANPEYDEDAVNLLYLEDRLANKQNKLESGTNIKTINGESILGEGNIVIEGGSGGSLTTRLIQFEYYAGRTSSSGKYGNINAYLMVDTSKYTLPTTIKELVAILYNMGYTSARKGLACTGVLMDSSNVYYIPTTCYVTSETNSTINFQVIKASDGSVTTQNNSAFGTIYITLQN